MQSRENESRFHYLWFQVPIYGALLLNIYSMKNRCEHVRQNKSAQRLYRGLFL